MMLHKFVIWYTSLKFIEIYLLNNFYLLFFPSVHRPVDIRNRPRIPIPDEDPYSVAENGGSSGSGSSGFGPGYVASAREHLMMQSQQYGRRSDKPPKLPPRDNLYSQEKQNIYRVNDHFVFMFFNGFW